MAGQINILIVDDSAFMRLLLTDLLSKDSELNVIGSAVDGKEAVSMVKSLRPDIVLLDMNMGEYDGIYAVERIMASNPIPILILSSVGNSNLDTIFDALELGAVDYINKPQRGGSKVREIGAHFSKHRLRLDTRTWPGLRSGTRSWTLTRAPAPGLANR